MTDVRQVEDYFVGRFAAMGGPCEVLIDADSPYRARHAVEIAEVEARRIERKFSRYLPESVVSRINASNGRLVPVDDETAQLLDYAASCYEMSDGMFDITSGVLRKAWTFDGGGRVPAADAIRDLVARVGWPRVTWKDRELTLPAGMEIDFGGIGKEYAVDRAAAIIGGEISDPCVVNFGGDLFATGPRRGGRAWRIGLEDPDHPGRTSIDRLDVSGGGVATSGDARRYVLHEGKRLGHILNPKTGWPVEDAPRSVTVFAETCSEAGTLSTLAYLRGRGAEAFLRAEGVRFRIV